MTNHTKGPWIVWDENGEPQVVTKTGTSLTSKGYVIANCASSECTKTEEAANARLIASAPRLLEALKELRSAALAYQASVHRNCTCRVSNESINILSAFLLESRKAIEAAEGTT